MQRCTCASCCADGHYSPPSFEQPSASTPSDAGTPLPCSLLNHSLPLNCHFSLSMGSDGLGGAENAGSALGLDGGTRFYRFPYRGCLSRRRLESNDHRLGSFIRYRRDPLRTASTWRSSAYERGTISRGRRVVQRGYSRDTRCFDGRASSPPA